jgi:streptogramin lyase
MERLRFLVMCAAISGVFFGCSSSSTSTPPTPAPQAVYVASANSPSEIAKIMLPLSATSTVTYLTPTGLHSSTALRFDHSANLWSVNDFTTALATGYTAPITNASTPFATINVAGSLNPEGIAFDATGNMWIADGGTNKVYEFTPPFSGSISPTPAVTISSVKFPTGLAFDAAGNLYVSDQNLGTIDIFNPPFTTGQSPTATPITGLSEPTGIVFDATGNLYIADFTGFVALKNAPTAGGGAISIKDTATGMNSPNDVALDRAGNLYVTDLNIANLYMFPTATTAFSATLAPSVTLPLGFAAGVKGDGIAIGAP